MINKSRLALQLGLSLSAIALCAPAFAQDSDTVSDSSELVIGKVVVTAQKREQDLQEVPLAVSAIGSEKLEQLNVRDTRDLSGLAPNVTIVQGIASPSGAVVSMRGLTSPASESFGLDQANAIYLDGVYIARSGIAAFDVMDIERVEVLRGPQGTLFGRNSTGGAIAFVTRDPLDTFQARASYTAGNFGLQTGKLSFDTGAVGPLSATLSHSSSKRDGTVDNILQPNDRHDPGARHTHAWRGVVKLDAGSNASLRYIYDWSKVQGNVPAFQLTNVANGTPRAPLVVNGQPGVTQTQQAAVAQYLATANFLQPGCAALAAPQRAYRDRICLDRDLQATDVVSGHNLSFQYNFDNGLTLKTVAGYREWDSTTPGTDLDGMGTFSGPLFSNATLFNGMPESLLAFIPSIPAAFRPFIAASPVPTTTQGLFDTNNVRDHVQKSLEAELSGDTDNIDWVVGAFYFEEEGGEVNPQDSGFVLDTDGVFLGNFGPLGPSFVAANPARFRMVVTNGLLRYRVDAESLAFYGQGTWYVGGRDAPLSITAGIRHTSDEKSMIRFQTGAVAPPTPDTGSASFDKTSWNLTARYKLDEDISVYGRVATGYRSGGFNAPDTTQAGTSTLVPFKPESVTSYELGFKSLIMDRRLRLNGAVYHNDFTDLAANIPVPTATVGVFGSRIANVGKVKYTGAELEGEALLSEIFSVDGNIGYVDVDFKEFLIPTTGAPGAPVVNIASIARPGYTSKWTSNLALNASFPLGIADMRAVGRIGYTYESPKYSFSNTISSPFNEQIKSDEISIFDAQLAITGLSFGETESELRFWVKNLTDEKIFVRGIDFGALGYAGGVYADPRTFGATLSVKY